MDAKHTNTFSIQFPSRIRKQAAIAIAANDIIFF